MRGVLRGVMTPWLLLIVAILAARHAGTAETIIGE